MGNWEVGSPIFRFSCRLQYTHDPSSRRAVPQVSTGVKHPRPHSPKMSSILPTSVGRWSYYPQWRSSRGKCFIFRRGYNIIYIYIHICIYLFMYLCIALFLCTKYKPYTSWLSTAHCTSNYKNVISHDIRTLSPFIFPNILITHYSHYIPWISPWISPFMMLNTQGTTNIDVENDCLSVRKMIYKCVASHMGSHIELLVYSSVIPITIW